MKEPDYKLIIRRQKKATSDIINSIDKGGSLIKKTADGDEDISSTAKITKAKINSFKSASSMITDLYTLDSAHGRIDSEWYKRHLSMLIMAGSNLMVALSEISELDKGLLNDSATELKAKSFDFLIGIDENLKVLKDILSDNDDSLDFVINKKSENPPGFAEMMATDD
jgi:hypothetical protein